MVLIFNAITPLGWSIISVSALIGIIGGNLIYKKFPNLFNEDKKMKKIINDPHLLMEKIKETGKIYDHTEDGRRVEIDLKVGIDDKTGKEVLVIEKKEPVKKLKEMKKEDSKKKIKPKKKVKKKGNKKGTKKK